MLLEKGVMRSSANPDATVTLQEPTVIVDTTAEEDDSAVNAVNPVQAQPSLLHITGENPSGAVQALANISCCVQ